MKSLKIFLWAGMLFFCITAWADVPKLINFQGRLSKDTLGTPVKDSTYSILFTIYDVPVGGANLWSETQSVATKGGTFNVNLGSSTALPDNIFDDTTRYLAMKVGADPEMSPRQRMVSNAYGYRVRTVDGATGGTISGDVDIQSDLTVSGNVGIGTASPLSQLHLESSNPISEGIRIYNTSASGDPNIHFLTDGVFQYTLGVDNDDGDKFQISAGSTLSTDERLTLTSTGNVGIGTSAPNEQLEITGNLRLPASTASAGLIKSGADRFIHNFGTDNFFAGANAGNLTLSGTGGNTGVGFSALQSLTTGSYNTAVGRSALFVNTTGYSNTAIGRDALGANTSGFQNTAVGQGALRFNTGGAGTTAVGYNALYTNTTGSSNTAVGREALLSNNSGYENTAMGLAALYTNTTGYRNSAVGFSALIVNTTGYYNTAVGRSALSNNTTGYFNTAVGNEALLTNTTGNSNTAIGYGANVSAVGLTNATAIGANATVGASNALVLGGTGTNAVNVGIGTTTPQGALDVTSTTGALIVPRMTTVQRDALTAVNGMIIYNTDAVAGGRFEFRENGAWVTK